MKVNYNFVSAVLLSVLSVKESFAGAAFIMYGHVGHIGYMQFFRRFIFNTIWCIG